MAIKALSLSEKVDLTLANLSILKTGKAKAIRFSTLEAICKALDCQPGDIGMKNYLTMTNKSMNLESAILGAWWLLSREDYTKDGQKRIDTILGETPVAILVYAKNYLLLSL